MPGPELRHYHVVFGREQFADEGRDKTGACYCETNHNSILHRLGVAANQNRKAYEEHYQIHNGIGYAEMLLAVELSHIFDFCSGGDKG